MNRKLIHWLGLTGLLALISYAAAVTFSPFGGKSRDFNAGMAEKMPHDCIGLG